MKIRFSNTLNSKAVNDASNNTLLHHQAFDDFYCPVIDFDSKLQTEKIVIQATTDQGEMLGVISGGVVLNPKDRSVPFAVINNIWIDPEKRKLGIASALHDAFLKKAKSLGAKIIDLNVDVRNKEGYSFWEKLGYETYQEKKKRTID
jgi:ribosomal protein S18 acetylase RimI-like enzyme